jgi:fatty-acyl-CoA synthase
MTSLSYVHGSSALPDEIRAFCRGAIAHYKVPRHVSFRTSFPMTVTGKVQKFALRAQVVALLGRTLQEAA